MEYSIGTWKVSYDEIPPPNVLLPTQQHTAAIVTADQLLERNLVADGVYIDRENVSVGVRTADCMPLALLSKDSGLILHVSRHTLLKGILNEAVNFMNPSQIDHIWFGPHICAKHFTFSYVGDELKQFITMYPTAAQTNEKTTSISLIDAVMHQISFWNIPKVQILNADICTYESDLPSYKRWHDHGGKGEFSDRFVTWIRRDE